MSSYPDSVLSETGVAGRRSIDRALFVRRTYQHLAGAVGVFVLLEALLLNSPVAPAMLRFLSTGRFSWLVVLGLFMAVSWIAGRWASSATSPRTQYLGLGVFILAEAIIFLPLLLIASMYFDGIIMQAALITGGLFLGLTWIAFTAKTDFSFLGGILKVGLMVALGLIVAGILFNFTLGIWFSGAMILLMGGSILYQTSNVMREYHTGQHVAAALALFASLATLFWYVLQFLMQSSRD